MLGNKVIDHEIIWGVGEQPFEVAVMYEVVDSLIQTIWQFPADQRGTSQLERAPNAAIQHASRGPK